MSETRSYDPRYERLETNPTMLARIYQADDHPQEETGWSVEIVIDHADEDTGLRASFPTREQAEVFYQLVTQAIWQQWVTVDGPFDANEPRKPSTIYAPKHVAYSCRYCGGLVKTPNGACGKHFL